MEIEYIEHDAVITEIDSVKQCITVRLTDTAECGGCPAAALCVGAKDTQKITIPVRNTADFRKGEVVVVRGTEQMHRKAIMLATFLPCVCLIAIMVIVFILTADQLLAALCGLGSMVLFFLLLYLCRNRIAHEFNFTVMPAERLNDNN